MLAHNRQNIQREKKVEERKKVFTASKSQVSRKGMYRQIRIQYEFMHEMRKRDNDDSKL